MTKYSKVIAKDALPQMTPLHQGRILSVPSLATTSKATPSRRGIRGALQQGHHATKNTPQACFLMSRSF